MKKFLSFLATVLLINSFAVLAVAADWSFYSSLRTTTLNNNFDAEMTYGANIDVSWVQKVNNHIGDKCNIDLSLPYDSENFIDGILHRDKTDLTFNPNISNQLYGNDPIMWSSGGFYGEYENTIQAKFGNFKVLVFPAVNNTNIGVSVDTAIKQIDLKYSKSFGSVIPTIFDNEKTYTIEAGASYNIDTMVLGVSSAINIGPAYIMANIFGRKNTIDNRLEQSDADDAIVDTNVKDNNTLGYLAVVGFKANDKLNFELGYGVDKHEIDTTGKEENNTSIVYLQAAINITDSFFIVPELGEYNYGDDSTGKEESMTYFGAKWQMNF